MTQENLEEAKSEVEEVKPTEPEKEPTISMVDTPEFKLALDKAVGKGVSSIQSLLSGSKTETETAKAETKALIDPHSRPIFFVKPTPYHQDHTP